MTRSFDAIIIGSGQAGPSLAARLADAGPATLLVERERLGGTCVNTGCMPDQDAGRQRAHRARRAARRRVRRLDRRAGQRGHEGGEGAQGRDRRGARETASTAWLKGKQNLTVVFGHARFVAPHAVAVGGEVYEAPTDLHQCRRPADRPRHGRAWTSVPFLTSSSMMDVDFLPEHLVVVGGSYIGLEFAQMYRRFGSRVSVLEYADRLIAREDPDVSDAVRSILEGEGHRVCTGARNIAVEQARRRRPRRVRRRRASRGGSRRAISCWRSVGARTPTISASRPPASRPTRRASSPSTTSCARTSRASGRSATATGAAPSRTPPTTTTRSSPPIFSTATRGASSDRIPAYALFTDPPLGRAGMTEAEVRASGRPALIGIMPMTRVGRAKERGETQGFMKVLVDAESKRILGAALLCIEGDEIVHSLLDVMAAGAPYTVVQRTMHIHPTVSELIPTLLGQPAAAGLRLPAPRKGLLVCVIFDTMSAG